MSEPEINFYDPATPEQLAAVADFVSVAVEFRNDRAIYAALNDHIADTETSTVMPLCGQPDRIEVLRESFAALLALEVPYESHFDDETEQEIQSDSTIKDLIEKRLGPNANQENIRANIFRKRFAIYAGRLIATECLEVVAEAHDDDKHEDLPDAG